MPDLKITIGGRDFDVSCQPGEEHFLRTAAGLLDAEASVLVGQIGRLPELRMLLMSGLMVADKAAAMEDQLRDLRERLNDLEAQVDQAQKMIETQSEPVRIEVPVEVPVEVRVEVPVEVPVEARVEVPVEVAVVPPEIEEMLAHLAASAEALADAVEAGTP